MASQENGGGGPVTDGGVVIEVDGSEEVGGDAVGCVSEREGVGCWEACEEGYRDH